MNKAIFESYNSLIEDSNYDITILSNTSAFLNTILEDINWVGFYLYHDDILILGPFQGNPACTKIPLNKGVCGASASKKQTLRIDNVHEFAGHIACDSRSNSEIVIPIIINNNLYGVLDIDSPSFNRFTNEDQLLLEGIVDILVTKLESIKKNP